MTGRRAALLGAVSVVLLACSGSPEVTGRLPDDFPPQFPIPDDAEVVSTGDMVVLHVPRGAEDTANLYERMLPPAGWDVTGRWQGADPHGQPTFGMVVERAGEAGALSFTPTDDDAGVVVRINLRQPTVTDAGPP